MAKAKIAQYQFNTEPVVVVTPEAETLFMCLADVNEVSGCYGGKLVFTRNALNSQVKFKKGKGKEEKGTFKDIINDMLDEAYNELVSAGKKVTKADKITVNTDKDGVSTGNFEMSCKNQEKPKIINKDRTVEKDFTTLLSNGSTMKAQLYLKPYTMQGKVGITAYLNTALLLDIKEYGSGSDMFDDDDFDDTSADFDDNAAYENDGEDY